MKTVSQRGWLFLIPALIVLAVNAFIPFMTVINYSFQDILPGLGPLWIGLENYKTVLQDDLFQGIDVDSARKIMAPCFSLVPKSGSSL